MLFLGMGELEFTLSFKAPSAFAGAFHVDIASGKVTLIHEMADGQVWTTDTPVEGTENWAASGVMERSFEAAVFKENVRGLQMGLHEAGVKLEEFFALDQSRVIPARLIEGPGREYFWTQGKRVESFR